MTIAAYIGVGIVAALHLFFLAMEMFFWDKPLGRRVFGLKADFAKASKTLAANQGLYNGFLAAGLIWGLTRRRLRTPGHLLLPRLRDRRRDLRRCHGQPEDHLSPGAPRRGGDGPALAVLTPAVTSQPLLTVDRTFRYASPSTFQTRSGSSLARFIGAPPR